MLNPKDRKRNDAKEHVSLKLMLMRTSVKPDTVIEAYFKFLIYDQNFGKHMEHLGKESSSLYLIEITDWFTNTESTFLVTLRYNFQPVFMFFL